MMISLRLNPDRTKRGGFTWGTCQKNPGGSLTWKTTTQTQQNPWISRLPEASRCPDFLKHQESEDTEVSSPSINFKPIHLTPHLPTQEEEDSMIPWANPKHLSHTMFRCTFAKVMEYSRYRAETIQAGLCGHRRTVQRRYKVQVCQRT